MKRTLLLLAACLALSCDATTAPLAEKLTADELDAIAQLTELAVSNPESPPSPGHGLLHDQSGSVHVALFWNGRRVGESWSNAGPWEQGIFHAIASQGQEEVDRVELFLPTQSQKMTKSTLPAHKYEGGLVGLDLNGDRRAPSSLVMKGRTLTSLVDARLLNMEPGQKLDVSLIHGYQVLVDLPSHQATELYRCNELLEGKPDLGLLAHGLGDWLTAHVDQDGRLPYVYLPATDLSSVRSVVEVREWLATWALARLNPRSAAFQRNLAFQIKESVREEGQLAWVYEPNGKACLGPVALAGLALLESGQRRDLEDRFFRATQSLRKPDGSFLTFHEPAGRGDGQDYYPGETLLFWAARYERQPDPALLEALMASFRYYRELHLKGRRPAFIPWQTQAAARLYRRTRDPWLAEWIFEMNDWLLPMQQWDSGEPPDSKGQFYSPEHPEWGAPHASATAVYLEGLASALEVARLVGDTERAERYEETIRRGLHNLAQLQYRGSVSSYLAVRPERARGALKTAPFDVRVRIDNVAHALNACLTLQELGVIPREPSPHGNDDGLRTASPTP